MNKWDFAYRTYNGQWVFLAPFTYRGEVRFGWRHAGEAHICHDHMHIRMDTEDTRQPDTTQENRS